MKKNWLIVLALSTLTFVVYLIFCKKEFEVLNYFLPHANSILHARLDVNCALPLNELVSAGSKCYVVYPFAPSLALIPFAFFFSDKISQTYPAIIYAALSGGLVYLFLRRLTKEADSIALSLFLVFGTNFFMTSLIGRSWYFAHVMAVFFLALSILFALKKKSFLAGLFLGLAGMSRLPVLLAFPGLIYLLKPSKKDLVKFLMPYGLIVLLFLAYNQFRFASPLQTGYSLIPGVLEESWYKEGIFSYKYIWRNLDAMLLSMPLYVGKFPWLIPNSYAMALWLASPALLLLGFSLKNRLSQVMIATFLLVMLPDFLHGVIGFSQFGYRFSLDGILFLIIALIPVLKDRPNLSYIMIGLSILINFYVVIEYYLGFFAL